MMFSKRLPLLISLAVLIIYMMPPHELLCVSKWLCLRYRG